jgi:DNA excision repair protein ERCC-4
MLTMRPCRVLPAIIVDSREQTPLPITDLPSERGTLDTGDYSVRGCEHLFAVERKTVSDLVSCCAGERDRFIRELFRLRGYAFKRLLIIGSQAEVMAHQYRSNIAPSAVLGSLAAWEIRFDIPVIWESDPATAAKLVCRWAWYFARELSKSVAAMTAVESSSHPTPP